MTAVSATVTATALRPRSRRCARLVLAVLSTSGLAALACASFLPANMRPLPRLVYNPSDSVAVGWYRVDPLAHPAGSPPPAVQAGSIVLVPLPADAAALAAWRGYLPMGIPLLKPVAAVAPQQVCIRAGIVRVNGVPVAAVLRRDGRGRRLRTWPSCRRLRLGELFLLSTTNSASFDSRYFGPVRVSTVLGIAHPVWLEKRP